MGHPDEPQPANVLMPAEMLGGVWANYAQISHSPYEFTLDFCRIDYSQQPPNGAVVARVNLSPLLVTQLLGALEENWRKYAERAMPKEVQGDAGEAQPEG